ncbi:MAG: tRNA pseudouridine(55) synthase TruB [Candidatus Nanopelagicales bacterium]
MSGSGLLILDKPSGSTSHDIVRGARRILKTRKVGHAGTLDPMATGVLVLGIGRATRLLGYISGSDKAYSATIRLGQSTITDDAEGEVLSWASEGQIEDLSFASVLDGMTLLTGRIEQVPSSVSAIKVDGQRAYAKVRAGDEVELAPRWVTIEEFRATAHRFGDAYLDVDVEVTCSSGTYIRALARDLGSELGVGGHLTSLRRTRVGPWALGDAMSFDAFNSLHEGTDPYDCLVSVEEAAARVFPSWVVGGDDAIFVRNGRRIEWSCTQTSSPVVAIFDESGAFLALAEQHGPTAKYLAVFV